MLFSQSHLDAFRGLSHDRNPLHQDAGYSRRTQFGRPVVYGMALVLAVLGEWARGRRFSLKSLQADFHKPVFPGETLELKLGEEGPKVRAEVLKGPEPRLTLVFEHAAAQEPQAFPSALPHVDSAAETPQAALFQQPFRYSLDTAALPRAADAFRLSPEQLPASQWNALCFSSYLVGMVCPGRQALFSSFNAVFDAACGAPGSYELACKPRAAIRLYTMTGTGWGLKSVSISAFERPLPKDDPIDALGIPAGKDFASKSVLVTGSSRGLGAVLAKAFALKGADVIVHYHRSKPEGERVLAEVARHSPNPLLLGADLDDPQACRTLSDAVRKKYGKLDILVLSASPLIEPRTFSEQTSQEFLAFLEASLRVSLNPLQALLPLARTCAAISSVYASSPPPQYTHYAAAKRALEGLLEGLSKEEKDKRFVTFRLPRVLTDQTNVPFSAEKPRPPAEAAAKVLQALAEEGGPGYTMMEL